jgi:hypothetical protein
MDEHCASPKVCNNGQCEDPMTPADGGM